MMNKEAVEKMIEILKGVDPKKFNMENLSPAFRSRGICALGHSAKDIYFKDLIKKAQNQENISAVSCVPAMWKILGIHASLFEDLFCIECTDDNESIFYGWIPLDEITKEMVIEELENIPIE